VIDKEQTDALIGRVPGDVGEPGAMHMAANSFYVHLPKTEIQMYSSMSALA
jgi:hypothetical protein